jgi:hypothetical protein
MEAMETRKIEETATEFSLSFPKGPPFHGRITKADIIEVGGVNPPNVIRSDQNWKLELDWFLAGWLLAFPGIGLNWQWSVSLRLDSMGKGTDYNLPKADFKVPLANHTTNIPWKWEFSATIPFTQGTVLPGVYMAVVIITCQDASSGKPLPIAGFAKLEGLVHFYEV